MADIQEYPAVAQDFVQDNAVLCAAAAVVVAGLVLYFLMVTAPSGEKVFLTPERFQDVMLADKRQLTHNTLFLRFALPDKKMRLGLPIGQHITFLMKDDAQKDVYRAYTPVSDDDLIGFVEFVIKVYPQGKMTQILDKLKPGDSVAFKGPKGRFSYKPNMKRAIGMIAGGTGITPMYQVAKAVFKSKNDKTQISVIFGNINEEDILIKEELEALAKENPDRFKVYYVLNNPPVGWAGGAGFISDAMITDQFPAPADDVLILRCGPPLMNAAMKKHLDALGYSADMQFEF